MAENEILKPQSRLDANSVAASRALDAERGAVNAERQGMQTERALQRKYRRAVRNEDYAGAAAISQTLAQTGGSTVGPVIRKAESERMVAGQRAIDRADQQMKIRNGGVGVFLPGDPRLLNPEQANQPPGAVNAGTQQGADDVASGKGALGQSNIRTAPVEGSTALGPSITPDQQEGVELFAYNSANAIEKKVSPSYATTGSMVNGESAKAIESARLNPVSVNEDDEIAKAVKQASRLRDFNKSMDDFEFAPTAPAPAPAPKTGDYSTTTAAPAKESALLNGPAPLSTTERNQLQNRKNNELARKELALDPIEPSPVFSGGMTITSPESRAAGIAGQKAAAKAERDQMAEQIIRKQIAEMQVPDWQRNTLMEGITRRFKLIGIRAGRQTPAMDAAVSSALASKKALLDAQKQNADFSKAVSNLLPTP